MSLSRACDQRISADASAIIRGVLAPFRANPMAKSTRDRTAAAAANSTAPIFGRRPPGPIPAKGTDLWLRSPLALVAISMSACVGCGSDDSASGRGAAANEQH